MATINKPSQPLIPPTDVEEVEEIAANAAEAAIAADDTHAPLVENLVPAEHLPSYVDDVLEYDDLAAFPNPGEEGKIYVARDTNNTYRWSGNAYIQINEVDLSNYYTSAEVESAIAAGISESLASGGAIDNAIQAAIGDVLNQRF